MTTTPSPSHDTAPEQELRYWSQLSLWSVLAAGAVLLAWALLAPLHSAVVARGILRVEQYRQVVQHPEGGIIKSILVKNGDKVRKGQALIELEDARISSGYDIIRQRHDAELAKQIRLLAEQEFKDRLVFPDELASRKKDSVVGEVLSREQELFRQRRATLRLQIDILRRQIAETEKEISAIQQQVDADLVAQKNMETETKLNAQLVAQGFVSNTRLLALQRNVSDYEARLAEHRADLSRAQQKQNDLRLRIEDLRNTYRQTAVSELKDTSSRLNEVAEQLKPALDAHQRQTIRAPMDGEVVNLKIHTIGAVLAPREPAMEVVPDTQNLLVEAKLPQDAISDLSVGMAAEVRLLAFQYRTTPLIDGAVTYLSADALTEANGETYYLGQVKLDDKSLTKANLGTLQPGMPAEIYLRTRERNAFNYFLDPIRLSIYRSFREK